MQSMPLNREALGLIPWLVASWLLAIAAAQAYWFAPRWGKPGRWLADFVKGRAWTISPGQILKALYALGLPYAAMLWGYLDAEVMGLSGLDWWRALRRGSLLGAGLLLLSVVVWRAYLRTGSSPVGLLERQRRLLGAPGGWLLFLPWAAAEQVHWAFYRALPVLLFGTEIGLWVGMLLVVAERYSSPQTTAALRQGIGLEEEAWWLTKAFAMTACYAVLRNLWFCILLHAIIEGVAAWLAQGYARPLEDTGRRLRHGAPVFPVLAFSSTGALLLLVLFTWVAMRPKPVQVPSAVLAWPTKVNVPTPTPTRTALPSPSATPTVTPTPLPPSPTSTVTPTPPITYIVQPGDTLKEIAERFGVGVTELMEKNGITDPTKLQIGQELVIP